MDTTLDPQVVALAKAIRDNEGGTDFTKKGKDGEFGAYQFMPDTWASSSQKYLGQSTPLTSSTKEQQNEVAYKQIKDWKDAGHNVGEIASMWNAGPGLPNAYIDGNKGTSTAGAPYDTKAYAKRVAEAYQTYKSESPDTQNSSGNSLASDITGVAGALGQGVLDVGNAAATGVNNLFGAGIGLVKKGLELDPLSGVTPTSTNPALEGVKPAAQALINSPTGKAVGKTAADFQEQHPLLSSNLGKATNIASTFLPLKGLSIAKEFGKETLTESARAIGQTGVEGGTQASGGMVGNAIRKKLFSDALAIVSPKETTGGRTGGTIGAANRQGRGIAPTLFSPASVEPEQSTIEAARAVQGIIKRGASMTENANIIHDEIGTEAQGMRDKVTNLEIKPIIQPEEVEALRQNALDSIKNNPYANAEDVNKIFNEFESYLPKNRPIHPEDILDARQKLDATMRSWKGPNILDPAKESSVSAALRRIRQGANSLMASKVPKTDVDVLESLRRQSAMYDALENVSAKASGESGKTGLGLLLEKHPGLISALKGAKTVGEGLVGLKLGLSSVPAIETLLGQKGGQR